MAVEWLYLETNYLMGVATGRYPLAEDLLVKRPTSVLLAIPEVCYMEAIAAFESLQSRRNQFATALDDERMQLREGIHSPGALRLISQLEAARLESTNLTNEFRGRLSSAMHMLPFVARGLPASAKIIRWSAENPVCRQPTDNLILHVITDHAAKRHEAKTFFTANSSDFEADSAGKTLRDAGIGRVLNSYDDLVNWLASRGRSSS